MKNLCLSAFLLFACYFRPCSAEIVAGPVDPTWDARITILAAPYPEDAKGEVKSSDGHRFILRDKIGGSGHSNEPSIFIITPEGKGMSVRFKMVYWETTECKWVNENLLFVRIWWGRHWGTDYIFDADAGKIAFSEGFVEPRVPNRSP